MMGAETLAYTLTFKKSDTPPSSNSAFADTDLASVFEDGASTYVSRISKGQNAKYQTKYGLTLGNGSTTKGYFNLDLTEAGKVNSTKIVIEGRGARRGVSLNVNGTDCGKSAVGDFAYEITVNSTLQTIVLNSSGIIYLAAIKVYVNGEGPGPGPVLEDPGLTFENATNPFMVKLGEDNFVEPKLMNKDGEVLNATYSSSKPEVASVDTATGKITLVAAGTTVITATTEATDKYKAGKAEYTLEVVDNICKSIADFKKLANGVEGFIDFETTVAYVDNSYLYLTDADGDDFISVYSGSYGFNYYYSEGNIIPGGWKATMKLSHGLPQLADGDNIPRTSIKESQFTPKEVDSIDTSYLNAVVVLKNVVFGNPTNVLDEETYYCIGTVGDVKYNFSNSFHTKDVDAGMYNVTLAVGVWDDAANGGSSTDDSKILLYPIAYDPIHLDVPVLMIGDQEITEDQVNVAEGVLNFNVPDGVFVYFIIEPDNTPVLLDDEVAQSANVPAKVIEIEGEMEHEDMPNVKFQLFEEKAGHKLDYGNSKISYFAYEHSSKRKSALKTVSVSNTTGIEGIDAEAGNAEYFDMLGRRVSNPANGLYIKRTNGASTKVLVK